MTEPTAGPFWFTYGTRSVFWCELAVTSAACPEVVAQCPVRDPPMTSIQCPDIDPFTAITPVKRVFRVPWTPSKVTALPTTEPVEIVKSAQQSDVPVIVPVPDCVRMRVSLYTVPGRSPSTVTSTL